MMKNVTWTIAGEAGFGIMSSGLMLAKVFTRIGCYVFATNDYPSLIRGGHNVVTVRIGSEPFMGMNRELHMLVGLNADSIAKHIDNVHADTIVIFDPKDKEWQQTDFPKGAKLFPLPLKEIITSHSADTIMRNTVALGATVAFLGASFESLHTVIADQFKHKGEEVVMGNVAIAKSGYDYVKEHYKEETSLHLEPGNTTEKIAVVNGSEAVGLGAVRAGLKFAAIYPMTPINSLITFLADHAKELNIVYKQPEDEIAGITMAIGASVAGARSMVATSGGGFALMVEGLSLAGMIEVPVVIDLGMRVGPATGMPTYTEQGELLFAIRAGHGEFARIILAPGDAEEAFESTILAFHLADKYHIPVFVLTDKYLNESNWSLPFSVLQKPVLIDRGKLALKEVESGFSRYDTSTETGVSLRSVPGVKNGLYYANSYEHDQTGHVTDSAVVRKAMADKRLRKHKAIDADVLPPTQYGDSDPEITLLTWGSTKGSVYSAADVLRKNGKKVLVIHYQWMYPFPIDTTKALLYNASRIIDIEQNVTGQLAILIREQTGIEIEEKLLKYDGRPFLPEEIVEYVNSHA